MAVEAESKAIFAFKTCRHHPGLMWGNAITFLSVSWRRKPRLSSETCHVLLLLFSWISTRNTRVCPRRRKREGCWTQSNTSSLCLSAGDLLPCCVLTWWQLARRSMWAASLKAVSANLLRGESFLCFSAGGALLVFIIPNRKEDKRRKHSLCSALSLSPVTLKHTSVWLGWFHCRVRTFNTAF